MQAFNASRVTATARTWILALRTKANAKAKQYLAVEEFHLVEGFQ